jgi:hypothetical protein
VQGARARRGPAVQSHQIDFGAARDLKGRERELKVLACYAAAAKAQAIARMRKRRLGGQCF